MSSDRLLHVTIVVGESSGDLLGASLMSALQHLHPQMTFDGIAGSKMIAAGCKTLYPMDRLSVMGFLEPLKRLPELLSIRRGIKQHVLKTHPDLFIGIDSPDFNIGLEEIFRKAGIKTVHYVSPSVWAWRRYRIHRIARAVDLMLTLLPFEAEFYKQHHVPVKFVGHPLADQLPLTADRAAARERLQLPLNAKILGILPGSRAMELSHLAKVFIQTARRCLQRWPDLQCVTSMVNAERRQQFEDILKQTAPDLPIKIFDQRSHDVIAASDLVLLTSGTVTLEAMLLKTPMVVAYRMHWFNYPIARALVHIDYFSLPNLIAGREVVPEFFQTDVTPEKLTEALFKQWEHREELVKTYTELHKILKQNASDTAAKAILDGCHLKESS